MGKVKFLERKIDMESGYIDPKIIQGAIDKFGKDFQLGMVEEECLELSMALRKLRRYPDDKEKINHVIEEIADVKIVMHYAEKLFPKELVDEVIDFKMNRLKGQL